jgi:hypothetical protein
MIGNAKAFGPQDPGRQDGQLVFCIAGAHQVPVQLTGVVTGRFHFAREQTLVPRTGPPGDAPQRIAWPVLAQSVKVLAFALVHRPMVTPAGSWQRGRIGRGLWVHQAAGSRNNDRPGNEQTEWETVLQSKGLHIQPSAANCLLPDPKPSRALGPDVDAVPAVGRSRLNGESPSPFGVLKQHPELSGFARKDRFCEDPPDLDADQISIGQQGRQQGDRAQQKHQQQGQVVVEIQAGDGHQRKQYSEPHSEAGRQDIDVAVFERGWQLAGSAQASHPIQQPTVEASADGPAFTEG